MTPVDRPIIILAIFAGLTMINLIFIVGVFIMSLDVLARYRDYLCCRGVRFQPGIAYRMRGSWCSRGVAIYLWGDRAKSLYDSLGYRWYHILPDGAPRVFLRWSFWKHVIGVSR